MEDGVFGLYFTVLQCVLFRMEYDVLWPLTIAYITLGIVGLVGNILVCVVISR